MSAPAPKGQAVALPSFSTATLRADGNLQHVADLQPHVLAETNHESALGLLYVDVFQRAPANLYTHLAAINRLRYAERQRSQTQAAPTQLDALLLRAPITFLGTDRPASV